MNRAVSLSFAAAPVSPQPLDSKEIDVSVIIVNFNVREFLRQSLLALRKALAPLAAEVFVVDNASNDGSAEMVRREFPEVQLTTNRENAGFAHANNQALRRAAGRLVVLLNPDTVVQEDTFVAIRAFFDKHPETGMVGCKVLNPDGTLQLACRRSFPTPWVAFTRLSGLSQLFPKSRWFGRYNLTYLPEDEAAEVEAISGSFMAVRREALRQVGPLDERFFLYGEDLDWCFRMRAAGWKIHYFPGTQIIHYKGESAKQSDLDNLRLFYQAMSQFVRKHFRPRLFWLFYWLLHLAIWFRAFIALAQSLVHRLAVPTMDLAFMQLSMAVAVWFRFERAEVFSRFLIVDAVYSFIWVICLALLDCYRRSTLSAYQAFVATSIGFFINASLTYFFKQYAFSRAVVLIAGGMNILLLSGWRLAMEILPQLPALRFGFAKGRMRFGRRTVIVGDFVADGALVEKLKIGVDNRYDLVGLISLDTSEVGKLYHGLPVLATLDGLDSWLKDNRIQEVIFSTQRVPIGRILQVMSRQRDQSLSFKLVPSHLDVIIGKSGIHQVNEVPLLEIENRLLQFGPALAKRVFDIFWAGFFALVSAPFFLFAWLLLVCARKGKLQALTIFTPQHGATRLWQLSQGGRLAKWPWLLAILTGKLSWVGVAIPSPAATGLEANGKKESSDASSPFPVALPFGVTDLAKINRHARLSEEEKSKLYLYYVTHYTPLLDLEILLRTLFRI